MLGLTQQQLAELIGVTYQQAHKYESGANRIAAGRLSSLARALGVQVGYFYDGLTPTREAVKTTPKQSQMLELTRNFMAILSRKPRAALCNLARSLADRDAAMIIMISTWQMTRPAAARLELCPKLGDDGLRKAAYRGG